MEKLEFQKIMDVLADRIKICEQQLSEIHTTDNLSQLSIARAADLKSFCVAEEELMTKAVMVDLYHIIGMGKLLPPQMMKFTYAIQEYLQYRPTIKAIAKHLDSIFKLPKIPVETQYKLLVLGDLTLCSEFGEGVVVDDASVADYEQIRRNNLLPFTLEGRQIKVDMTQLDYFIALLTKIFNTNFSADNCRNKMMASKEYFGIEWISCNCDEAIGHFKSEDIYTRLYNYYKKGY